MPLPFRALGVALAVASMTQVAAADTPASTPSAKPLSCAVENELEILRTGRVCEVLDANWIAKSSASATRA